jgi:hypothetical protein
MLRVLAVAAMLAVVVPSLAMAEEHDDHHGGPPHPGGPPQHPGPPGGAMAHPGPPPGPMAHPGPVPGAMGGPRPGAMEGRRPGAIEGPRPGAMEGPRPGGGAQFSYHGHTVERVHRDPFIYPQGFGYRRWEVGAALPLIFLTPDYYYPEWAALGLEPPPPGCQWVRYGPDLILVDVRSGQVVDTAYDVFD